MKNVLFVFGTRPEAIKMAPIILKMKNNAHLKPIICVTGQHKEMLQSVMNVFQIHADFNLDIMQPNQSLSHIMNAVTLGTERVIQETKPNIICVHGDVTSAVGAAFAGFYQNIPVHHIEAGLRTGDIYAPWPEEMNRRLVGTLSQFHYAPTKTAKDNLLKENIKAKDILVTGNSVIDSLIIMQKKISDEQNLQEGLADQFNYLDFNKKIILVTGHRRENFDCGLEEICHALLNIAHNNNNVQIIYPVHLNPKVRTIVNKILKNHPSIFLVEPIDYLPFVYLMMHCYLIITDSGGLQEEAPSFGKPVLVTRENTERPEAVQAGTVKLVGTNREKIVESVSELLNNSDIYQKMALTHNPYGDGQASDIIINHLLSLD